MQARTWVGSAPPDARSNRARGSGDGFVENRGELMPVQLNHTIVRSHDREASARFLTDILGLPDAASFGPFLVVELDNGVSLDFAESEAEIASQHYAFLITEAEFDEIYARIRDRDIDYWADPGRSRPGAINHRDGGRGLYFQDPNGHFLEIITRPYGSA
jgi:catechol 2,3-dioxygenase-like lactoylglutathione lyase family enzyme